MRPISVAALCLLLVTVLHAAPLTPPLIFHASFDGTTDAVATGDGKALTIDGPVAYRPGKVGQALLCGEGGAAIHYATAGNLRAAGGTIEMWVCPLDWTGKEDEFHVFLEAVDPGWLVLYRYYQGGILTLTGTDQSHYTSAASPSINWKPGEWHHLAGTWRARRLEIYIDGKQAGVAEAALLPEKLADSFVVGDRPWHVARQRQTLVDEVKLYAAPLDPESIALAAAGKPIAWKPQLLVTSKVDPAHNTMQVNVDATGLTGEVGPGRTATVQLVPKGQTLPAASAVVPAFSRDAGQAELSLAKVGQGEYELQTVLLDQADKEVARVSSPFTHPGPPVWTGNKLGTADKVLAPWTPLRTDKQAATGACWGRRYDFGGLLKQVQSQGVDLLASPVTLEAVVGGQAVALSTATAKAGAATDTKATFTAKSEAAGLRATFSNQLEYDGFTWSDLAIEAAKPVKVDELRLTWKMPRTQAMLTNVDAMNWTNNLAGAIKAEGFTLPFVPYFWVGNEDRGLSWYCESKRNWGLSADKPVIEVRPQGNEVTVTIRLIARPTEIAAKLDFGFGMMATPVRPYPADAMRWRMTPGVRPTFDIIWPNGNMKYYGYTDPIDGPKFAERVKTAHAENCKVVPYINLNFASAGIPEWQYYGGRWADPDRVVTPGDVAQMGYASMGTCPASKDWQDFILYRINEMIDKYMVDGIYIDCWGPSPCKAAGCGWKDADGKLQATYPIRAYRDLIRRVYTLFHERQRAPLMMVHMSSEVEMPLLSFTDTILDGEQFTPGKFDDDYVRVLSPEHFRAEFLGRNQGPVEFFLPEFRPAYTPEKTANLAAYLLLHGINAWPIWSNGEAWNKLYDAMDKIGIGECTFLPYWQGAAFGEGATDLLSAYVGKGQALLVAVNVADKPGEAQIKLDLARLKMKSVASATDVFTGEKLKLEGGVLTVPQEMHQGRVIWLKPSAG